MVLAGFSWSSVTLLLVVNTPAQYFVSLDSVFIYVVLCISEVDPNDSLLSSPVSPSQ